MTKATEMLIAAECEHFRKEIKGPGLPFAPEGFGQADADRVRDLLREIGTKCGRAGLRDARKVLDAALARLEVSRKAAYAPPPSKDALRAAFGNSAAGLHEVLSRSAAMSGGLADARQFREAFFNEVQQGLFDILEKAGADMGGEGYAETRGLDRLDAVAAKVEAVGAEVRAQGEATRAAVEEVGAKVEAVGAPVSALVEERETADAAVEEQFKSEAFETWAGGFNFATPGGPETRWAKFVTFCGGEDGRAFRHVLRMMGAEDFERRCQNRMRKLRR